MLCFGILNIGLIVEMGEWISFFVFFLFVLCCKEDDGLINVLIGGMLLCLLLLLLLLKLLKFNGILDIDEGFGCGDFKFFFLKCWLNIF